MTERPDPILTQLPARLKDARRAQGLSLDAVAKLSGVSRSMVSQIERGESSPTIATLFNLTRALQVDFAGLLEQTEAPKVDVLRAGAAPSIDKLGERCRIDILSPPEDVGRSELYRLNFGAGGRLDSQPHNRGTREVLTVLTGSITVRSGEDENALSAGDTARYPADVPHAIRATDGPASALLIVLDE